MNKQLERVINALENAKGEPTIVHDEVHFMRGEITFTKIYDCELIFNNFYNEWFLVIKDDEIDWKKCEELKVEDYGVSWFIDQDKSIQSYDRADLYRALSLNSWNW